MLMKQVASGHLVEVLNLTELTNPFETRAQVQFQWGEELPEPEYLLKAELCFPSGEALPRCWVDSHYRDAELLRR